MIPARYTFASEQDAESLSLLAKCSISNKQINRVKIPPNILTPDASEWFHAVETFKDTAIWRHECDGSIATITGTVQQI
jgi:hypothetical protein